MAPASNPVSSTFSPDLIGVIGVHSVSARGDLSDRTGGMEDRAGISVRPRAVIVKMAASAEFPAPRIPITCPAVSLLPEVFIHVAQATARKYPAAFREKINTYAARPIAPSNLMIHTEVCGKARIASGKKTALFHPDGKACQPGGGPISSTSCTGLSVSRLFQPPHMPTKLHSQVKTLELVHNIRKKYHQLNDGKEYSDKWQDLTMKALSLNEDDLRRFARRISKNYTVPEGGSPLSATTAIGCANLGKLFDEVCKCFS